MTLDGTAMYQRFTAEHPVPELVRNHVAPSPSGSTSRTRSIPTRVGWSPETELFSIELDPPRAEATAELFAACPNVTVLCGDADELASYGPFDLLVLDAPGDTVR